MIHHTVFIPGLDPDAQTLTVTGEEGAHASRVKRLRPGEGVLALNGRGLVLECEVLESRRDLTLTVLRAVSHRAVAPAVHVYSATPKGPRVGDLIDALSQVGAASWIPLRAERQAVEPTDKKLDRLERIAVEATKQCQRAWLLDLGAPATVPEALRAAAGERVVLADGGGEPYSAAPGGRPASVRLLIGPEGGWSPRELDLARGAGAAIASFGPHVMRIEVAAPTACAIILHAHRTA